MINMTLTEIANAVEQEKKAIAIRMGADHPATQAYNGFLDSIEKTFIDSEYLRTYMANLEYFRIMHNAIMADLEKVWIKA